MPRRHNREPSQHDPLTIDSVPVAPPPRPWEEIKAEREARAKRVRQRTEARRIQRITDAIDWGAGCLVPGCDERVFSPAAILKDPEVYLPLCGHHEVVVWAIVQRGKGEPTYIDLINTRYADRIIKFEAEDEAGRQAFKARQDGQIYFLRLNGLIKVGWSRALRQRLKAYGPDVVVLCHYPATRQEETDMHRSLRPYLAKGREWYSECRLIDDMVAAVIEKHGPPSESAYWTEPKPDAVRLRRRTA